MFQPVVPLSGLAGWSFLNRTLDRQLDGFRHSSAIERDITYFRDTIGSINTAEELVADRRLLSVSLGAFGLADDINNKFFIKEILNSSELDQDALANRLTDRRYKALAKAFGFGDFATPNTKLSDFPDKIIEKYTRQSFEVAVGAQSEELRLALGLDRDLTEVADQSISNDGKWFTIMGTPPLRRVFETALGLPTAVAALDVDRQLEIFKERSARVLGTSDVSELAEVEIQEDLVRVFLARAEIGGSYNSAVGQSAALTLLQNAIRPPVFF